MLKGKRQSPAGARYFAEWEKEALCLMAELEAGTYAPGPYPYFEIHEPKRRVVAAAPLRDRVVHHALVQVLEPLFEPRFIEDSYACRKGKGTHAGMRQAAQFAQRFPWVVKCDIQRYFPSIDQTLLTEKLQRVVGDKRLLVVVDRVLGSHCDRIRQEWPPPRPPAFPPCRDSASRSNCASSSQDWSKAAASSASANSAAAWTTSPCSAASRLVRKVGDSATY
jgi:RNA-directed DNA polymerase